MVRFEDEIDEDFESTPINVDIKQVQSYKRGARYKRTSGANEYQLPVSSHAVFPL